MTVVEIDSSILIILSIAFAAALPTTIFVIYLRGKNKVQQDPPKGVKKTSKDGQEQFVEVLRDSASETIAYLQDEIKRLKGELKSKNGVIAKLNGLMYGTNDPAIIAEIEADNKNLPAPSTRSSGRVDDGMIQNRMQMIMAAMQKNNVSPLLLEIPEIANAVENIAASPNFERIAATILQTNNKISAAPAAPQTNDL